MAELTAGQSATNNLAERARRQDRLQRDKAVFDPLRFGIAAARAHGRVFVAVLASGRRPRRRFADLLIASVAIAEELPLLTQNAADFIGLTDLVDIIGI